MKFYSQLGQDRYLLENFFKGRRGGVFVDIGAYDGETYSNTLFFERSMGWTGLCVEPLPSAFLKLKTIRRVLCENVCVSDFEGEADFVEADAGIDERMLSGLQRQFDERHIERLKRVAQRSESRRARVVKLPSLLERHGLFRIDYCSIDTEGSELSILSTIDFERFRISVLTIENNYDDPKIGELMERNGYVLADRLEQDYVYRRKDVAMLPRITAICAVPSGLAERDLLLRGHSENLRHQTIPIEPFYVFDSGAEIPSWLEGRAVTCGAALTSYQAFNVALFMTATPLAMTTDIAARLAPDAAEILERERSAANAIAAYGDWRLSANQAEADDIVPCFPSGQLPEHARLVAGNGPYDCLGPSVLWRMDAHLNAPRYPWRLREGTLLREAGEGAWRAVLAGASREKIVHVPLVIGNCVEDWRKKDASPERSLLHDPGPAFL